MTLTVYPPVEAEGDLNEQGLTALATAGDFDILITGDMAGATERRLAETYALPDVEVLVVSHHGSRYGSDETFCKPSGRRQPSSAWGTTAMDTRPRRRWSGCAVWGRISGARMSRERCVSP